MPQVRHLITTSLLFFPKTTPSRARSAPMPPLPESPRPPHREPASDPPHPDLGHTLTRLARYLSLRFELFGLEAKEASQLLGRRLLFLILGAFFLLFTYLIALLTLAFWLHHQLLPHSATPWQAGLKSLLIIGGTQLLLALLTLTLALRGQTRHLFTYTKRELQKDRAWLHHHPPN